jgi:hypothetical protein
MATLQELLGGGLPAGLLSPEQEAAAERRAQNAALLNFAFGALQASRGQPGQAAPSLGQVIGQAGPVGMQAYQQSFDQTLANTLRGIQLQDLMQKRQDQERLARAREQFTKSMADISGGVVTPQLALSTGAGPTVAAAETIGKPLDTAQARQRAAMEFLGQVSPETLAAQALKPPERVTLKPGEQVIEPTTGRVLAQIPPTPDKVDLGTHIAFYNPQDPTKPIITLPKGKDPKDLTSTEISVGSQFNTQASPFISIGQNYKKIEAAAKNPSAAGDISLIFGYMKLLDPTSVVREGEFATAQNAGSVPDRIFALYNKALTGETLKSNIREDFVNQAKNLVRSQQEIYKQTVEPRFNSIVESAKLNKQNVMFDPFAGIDLTPSAAKPAEPAQRQAPTIRQSVTDFQQRGVTGGITVRRIGD